jgi:YD repeat-containing protein
MRNLLGLFIVVLLVGCDATYYPITITNNSSKTVAYTYDGSSDTLAPTFSKGYQVKAYTQDPNIISIVPEGPLSVKLSRGNESYTFENVSPIDLHVANTLPFSVTIKADSYIDAGSGLIELTVEANTEITTAKIYNSKPKFIINSSTYSVKAEYVIIEDIMYVTLK